MKFGEAITLLNAGHPMTREGWNGKGMFIIRAGGYAVLAEDARPNGIINTEFLKRRGLTHLEIMPHIDMWTAQNTYLAGWLASQSDMLAGDWKIYVEPSGAWGTSSMEEHVVLHKEMTNALRKQMDEGITLKGVAHPQAKKPHWTQTPEGKKKMAARKRRSQK
jgi:hypothetical protein